MNTVDAQFPVRHVPALQIEGVSKSYSGNIALLPFDLSIEPGEIHVLLGENGSGKSTLIKAISGYHSPDPGGSIHVHGSLLTYGSPDQAYRLGCRFVHQDLGLLPTLSVVENLTIGSGYPTRMYTIRERRAIAIATESLARVGLSIDPKERIANLSASQKTGVALARALHSDQDYPPRVLVLDEPTATLPVDEVDHLLRMVRAAAETGCAVLFVTHHLEEVFRAADQVTVLRDGRKVGTSPIGDIDRPTLVRWIVGDEVEQVHPTKVDTATEAVSRLDVRRLSAGVLEGVSLSVAGGEIVGVAGLTGSGRETVLGVIFGAIVRDGGEVYVDGVRVREDRPDLSISLGMAYLPGDRKISGGFMTLTARENFCLPKLRPFWRRLGLSKRLEASVAETWFTRLRVRPENAGTLPLASFSGGNQQKILFGKWLRLEPAVLIVDEPTQGVDVGAKSVLHNQLVAVAASGSAVLISSTDIEELSLLCSRILVFRDGIITEEIDGEGISPSTITRAILTDKLEGPGVGERQ